MGDRTDTLLGDVCIALVDGDPIHVSPLPIRKAQEWLKKTRSKVNEALEFAQANSADEDAAAILANAVLDAVLAFGDFNETTAAIIVEKAPFASLYAAYERMLEVADPLSVVNAASLRQAEATFAKLKGVPQELLSRVIAGQMGMAASGGA